MTITVFGVNGRGGHNVGVTVGGITATIFSDGPEDDAACVRLAEAIERASASLAELDEAKRLHAVEIKRLRGIVDGLEARVRDLGETQLAALEGRRRFFGPVLCVPVTAGDWAGPVWLLDPEKQDRGFGLRFESLRELRELHPELWIVDVTECGVLLDAVKLEQRKEGA